MTQAEVFRPPQVLGLFSAPVPVCWLEKDLWILGLMDCLTGRMRESTYNIYVERQNKNDPLTYQESGMN